MFDTHNMIECPQFFQLTKYLSHESSSGFHAARHKPMQRRAHGIAMNVLGQPVDIDPDRAPFENQPETLWQKDHARSSQLSDLNFHNS